MRFTKIGMGLAAVVAVALAGGAGKSPDAGRAVVVELFTSEGCSSCPPADRLLTILHERQPVEGVTIIALSEHVDYWNRLGWKDPFSSAQFTERQQIYSTGWPLRLYTPQMVIDGAVERLGGDGEAVVEAVRAAGRSPKAEIRLRIEDGLARIEVGELPRGAEARLWLALVEDGVSSDVARGENKGRRLEHVGVVRQLTEIGEVLSRGGSFEEALEFGPGWRVNRAVAFVQEKGSRRIVGAAQVEL